jgi:hypothetical protein
MFAEQTQQGPHHGGEVVGGGGDGSECRRKRKP